MKIQDNIKVLLFFLLIYLTNTSVSAQVVWPGDTNNNGVVNAVDWIYYNQAFGSVGPARPGDQMGIEWGAKSITSLWGTTFPGTAIDLVYADCDGDGIVTIFDEFAIEANFLQEHGIVDVDIAIAGTPEADPELFLQNESTNPFPQGETVFMTLHLGTLDMPVESFTGIAFDIEYDPAVINSVFFFPFGQDMPEWGGSELTAFQVAIPDEGKTSLAFSTIGMSTVEDGFGMLGQFFIVIEDDVLGMQGGQIETSFMLENVVLLGPDLDPAPVVNDTVNVTIVENPLDTEEYLNPEEVEIFPNPAKGHTFLKTNHIINRVEIFNAMGDRTGMFKGDNSTIQELNLSNLAAGIHLLKLYTDDGVLTKKIVIY